MNETDVSFIRRALLLAKEADRSNEVPIGAVLVKKNEVIGEGFNQPIILNDPTAHAEIIALRRAAARIGNYRLIDTTLYVTLEPCVMCLGAMIQSRVKRLFFGAYDLRMGAVTSVFQLLKNPYLNHRIDWCGGILIEECAWILKNFFRMRR
ncbi:tRNA adenosine(34) deaminase TadA [Coxiella endosymbiont of Amblyomma nuttalli]|uniref:tRNA adenosine(34) deaminase TadA n=1 Tax=Coxiella endosymbiont of Amblyomma nuttalli TaxID=2749996 RepID=UPI001BA94A8A|nr:tRNA adenosine(34) deaminase TadA [Coxiella endosymbiont of Amblyomma nuttalli]QTS83717.1 tRNA-specific adenosine deaminase [Coxiella endosymbiont of Amblyomma nuttalli]